MKLTNKHELTELIGVDERTISRWQKEPGFPYQRAERRGQSNQYDVRAVVLWAVVNKKSGFVLSGVEKEEIENLGGKISFEEAKRRREVARAEREEIELAATRKDFLPAVEVERVWRDHIAAVRAKLLALPPKAAAQLVGVEDRTEIQRWAEEQVYEALYELAGQNDSESDGRSA